LRDRLGNERTDRKNGVVRVVRGGGRLLRLRRTLDAAGLSEAQWRDQWDAARWFLSADGETGKRYGNETIRVTPAGQVSIRLPRPLAHLANAAHGRYVLTCTVAFAYRGDQWQARVEANQAVAYRIHYDTSRGRWYLTAAWQHPAVPPAPLTAARAGGMIGVDTNAGHFAAYRLDHHGNPAGRPQRFGYNLAGGSGRRDAQVRHAITRLLHWTRSAGAGAIGIEDLNFADETREKHGRNKQFRRVISGIPTGRLRARLVSMAAEQGLPVVAVDPAYTTRWGGQHWRKPLTGPRRPMTGHDAAAVAIGRRALGYPVRRRTAPPRTHQSDGDGHRAGQAGPGTRGRDGTRHPATDRPPEDRRRAGP
jgi:IS605 OrfB family transposase